VADLGFGAWGAATISRGRQIFGMGRGGATCPPTPIDGSNTDVGLRATT